MIYRKWLILIPGLLLTACVGGQGQPDWVSGTSREYPAERYLVGVGQADQREVAKDRARADLAKVFAVQIEATSKDITHLQSVSDGEKAGMHREGEITRHIETSTDRLVEGVQVSEVWQDPETRQFHALATLSRLQAGNAMRQEITQLDAGTQRYLQQAQDTDDLLIKIQIAYQAVTLQQTRLALQKTLKVIDPSGLGAPPKWLVNELQADVEELMRRLRFHIEVKQDESGILQGLLANSVAAAGFTVDTGGLSPYVLVGDLSISDLGRQQGWYWLVGTLDLQLYDRKTNEARGNHQWPIKVPAKYKKLTHPRLQQEVDKLLKNELQQAVLGLIQQAE